MKLHNRIWHWATAVLIFMLLFLLLLTKTIFSPGANNKAIQETIENAINPSENQSSSSDTASTEPTSSQITSSHPNQGDSTSATFSNASNSVQTIKLDTNDLKDLSKAVAKIYSRKFWDLHFYIVDIPEHVDPLNGV